MSTRDGLVALPSSGSFFLEVIGYSGILSRFVMETVAEGSMPGGGVAKVE